jgi:hypothetical protein
VRPIAILDYRGYTTDFSTRANNAGACVANYAPESFLDVMAAMFEQQPSEGGPGLGNSAILDIVQGAGVDDPDVAECVTGESFEPWVTAATVRSRDHDVTGTPSIFINGTKWDPQSIQFEDFVAAETAKLGQTAEPNTAE